MRKQTHEHKTHSRGSLRTAKGTKVPMTRNEGTASDQESVPTPKRRARKPDADRTEENFLGVKYPATSPVHES